MALAGCSVRLLFSILCVLSMTGVTAIPASVTARTTVDPLAPRIHLHNPSPNLTQGTTAHFSCDVVDYKISNGNPHYQFWRGDLIVASTYSKYFNMTDLKLHDSGEYWCSIMTSQGKLKSSNTIAVYVKTEWPHNSHHPNTTTRGYSGYRKTTTVRTPTADAPTLYLHQPLAVFYEGASITFTCRAPGYAPYEERYELTKDGRVVTQQKGNEFSIYNLKSEDSGRYSCAVLLIYRKLESHNSVMIEVAPYSSAVGDGDYYPSSGMGLHDCPRPTLVASMMMVLAAVIGVIMQ